MNVPETGDPPDRALLPRRLREVLAASGGHSAVAKRAGVSESTLNKWLAGAEPGALNLRKIADATGSTMDYLVGRTSTMSGSGTAAGALVSNVYGHRSGVSHSGGVELGLGRGDAPVGSTTPALAATAADTRVAPALPGFIPVPRLAVRASAGGGQVALHDDETDYVMMLRESWLRSLGVTPRNAQFLSATGDGMEPTIRDGDLLLVDRGIDRVVDNGIYVVVLAGLVMVKRLQVLFDGAVVLSSDNDRAYRPETVPHDRAHELVVEGRVKWYVRSI